MMAITMGEVLGKFWIDMSEFSNCPEYLKMEESYCWRQSVLLGEKFSPFGWLAVETVKKSLVVGLFHFTDVTTLP